MTFALRDLCFEIGCHSDPERSEGEESRPGLLGVAWLTQSAIPRFARNDISWFLRARQPAGMTDRGELFFMGVPGRKPSPLEAPEC